VSDDHAQLATRWMSWHALRRTMKRLDEIQTTIESPCVEEVHFGEPIVRPRQCCCTE
jgi:hypothetical protein